MLAAMLSLQSPMHFDLNVLRPPRIAAADAYNIWSDGGMEPALFSFIVRIAWSGKPFLGQSVEHLRQRFAVRAGPGLERPLYLSR